MTRADAHTSSRRTLARPLNAASTKALARAAGQAKDDDVAGLAAEMAYRASLAVLPFLLMLSALPSVVGSVFGLDDINERLTGEADRLLSDNSAEMMNTLITEVGRSQGWTPFVFGLFGTLWAGTLATSALRKSLNRIYRFDETTPVIRRKLLDLGLTIAAGILLFLAIMAMVIGPALLGGETAITEAVSLVVAVSLVLVAVSLLYWLAPSGENTYRWVTPGALVFGLGWLLFSLGFSVYLSRFGMLNHVYGSLGAMIVLLIWLYGSNLFLLLGAELNAALAQDKDPNVERSR